MCKRERERKNPAPLKSDHSSGKSLNRGSTVVLWNRVMFVCEPLCVCVCVCVLLKINLRV